MPDQPSIPTLSRRTLQRTLLARQLLLERARPVDPRGHRAGRRAPDPVRAVGLCRAVEPPGGLRAAALTTALEDRSRRPGDAHANDHPHGLAPRVLAVRPGRPPGPPARWVLRTPSTRAHATARCVEPRGASCGRRWPTAPHGQGARRPRDRVRRQHRAVGRPRAGAALGHVGASPSRPARAGRRLGRPEPTPPRPRASPTSSGPTCGHSGRRRGGTSRPGPACPSTDLKRGGEELACVLSRRGWQAAGRPGRRPIVDADAGTGPLPPALGCQPARARAPHRPAAGGLPAADLQHEEPVLGRDVPRRRDGRRGVVAARRSDRPRSVRGAVGPATRAAVEREREALEAFHR